MKEIQIILNGKVCTAINLGTLESIGSRSFSYQEQEMQGKVFTKDLINSTGTEISFSVLPPKSELPFFHSHIKNEETYIIVKGSGCFQVDEDCFEIKEGSVIRIAPEGKRNMYNSSDEPMIFIVVQSKANSLEEYT